MLGTLACNFIKKESLAQVFYCEFCEISKNTFFTEHLRIAASGEPLYQSGSYSNWSLFAMCFFITFIFSFNLCIATAIETTSSSFDSVFKKRLLLDLSDSGIKWVSLDKSNTENNADKSNTIHLILYCLLKSVKRFYNFTEHVCMFIIQ